MLYLFDTPIPAPWLLVDLLTLAITLLVVCIWPCWVGSTRLAER